MHILTARIGEHNAVIISQKTLRTLMGCSRPTVQRALDVLAQDRWIEVRQVGESGTVNAYVINDRVAWATGRDGLRYSLFSAAVVLSEEEQPDRAELGRQEPLRKVPSLFRDERQLPNGPGLPPERIPLLLQRGVRGDERVHGHGIGLSIVQDIVRSYRGQLSVGASEELGGARFEVRLPPGL